MTPDRQKAAWTQLRAPLVAAAVLMTAVGVLIHLGARQPAGLISEGSGKPPNPAGSGSMVLESMVATRRAKTVVSGVGAGGGRSRRAGDKTARVHSARSGGATAGSRQLPQPKAQTGAKQRFCMIYMKPHKTGSESVRLWMEKVERKYGLRKARCADFIELPQSVQIKHYRSQEYDMYHCHGTYTPELRDAIEAGCRGTPLWVTGTRDPRSVLYSKYFWWTGTRVAPEVTHRTDPTIEWRGRRMWLLWWRAYDPCEALDYYDGLGHCQNATGLSEQERLRSILAGIDVAVRAGGDGGADLECVCRLNGWKFCPRVGVTNRVSSGYEWLSRVKNALPILDGKDYVQTMLHEALVAQKLGRDEAVCNAAASKAAAL